METCKKIESVRGEFEIREGRVNLKAPQGFEWKLVREGESAMAKPKQTSTPKRIWPIGVYFLLK